MGVPSVYEINTRAWLRDLADRFDRRITLADVPESEILDWRNKGFTHIWLMGVWTTGERSAEVSRRSINLHALRDETGLQLTREEIIGSPYAITHYEISPRLGGPHALTQFRQRLHSHGLKLILDFVPNHTALDHPWVQSHPEYFISAITPFGESFPVETAVGQRWIAHGKDPYFPAWTDTAQLDYRNGSTQREMIQVLREVALQCDGVRCDMAMLLLSDVFGKTWRAHESTHGAPPEEFWKNAIAEIRQSHPEFLFLAEAYWDLEPRLIELGFDYAYNKRVLDSVVEHRWSELWQRIYETPPGLLEKYTHFLENHDEQRIASRLSKDEHALAAFLILCLPGMTLLHEGQLTGAKRRASVHLDRRLTEAPDPEIASLYNDLLQAVQASEVGKGKWQLLSFGNEVLGILWRAEGRGSLAIMNFGGNTQVIKLPAADWRTIFSLSADFEPAGGVATLKRHAALLLQTSARR